MSEKSKSVDQEFTYPHIPPERVGLHGKYDQYGLAKRVAAAFDDDPEISNIHTLYIEQIGSIILLKGKIRDQSILLKAVDIAACVGGVSSIDFTQVEVIES